MTPCDAFHGAKLLLVHDGHLLTYLRDDLPNLPFPTHWDLPGGGRERDESPVDCALRELREEFGLRLMPSRLAGQRFRSYQRPDMWSWLFTGDLTPAEIVAIRFGTEGQEWRMMPLTEYLTHSSAIPHFQDWIRVALAQK